VGITSTPRQVSNVTAILQQNNLDLCPEAMEALRKHLLQEPEVIEAEIE
jgi:hypothetical protein